jgi:hypothetical protein
MRKAAAAQAAPDLPRPKTLGKIAPKVSPYKPDLARVYRLARESWGGSQEELSDALGGVGQKFISWCESDEQRETFNTVHLAVGPTEWSLPIMSFMVVRVGAQITRAVEIQHKLHIARLAAVVQSTSGLTCEYSAAVAREQEAWSVASLEAAHKANRRMLDTTLETDRALSVALLKARAGR